MKKITAILIACVIAANGNVDADDDRTTGEIIKRLAELEAKQTGSHSDLDESERAYRLLFTKVGPDRLSRLQTLHDDSIAIQSAWEQVALTVPIENGRTFYRPDSQKLSRFLDLVQQRARVALPDWWREVVPDARANRRDNIYHGKPKSVPYRLRTGMEQVGCPKNASVEKEGNSVVYRVGTDKITIPAELQEHGNRGPFVSNVSGCFTDKYCFLAVHENVGYRHQVGCIERASGKLVWKSTACGSWWGNASGSFTSWVAVVPTDDGRVFVFGAAGGFYLHGFRASDGKPLVRFSTNFSGKGGQEQ
jgi:hypothetical protein